MAFASPEIIAIFSKIKYPYNVNLLTQKEAIAMMHRHYEVERWVKSLLEERARLIDEFIQLPCCEDLSDRCQFLFGKSDGCEENICLLGK